MESGTMQWRLVVARSPIDVSSVRNQLFDDGTIAVDGGQVQWGHSWAFARTVCFEVSQGVDLNLDFKRI